VPLDLQLASDRTRLDRLRASAPAVSTIALSPKVTPEVRALGDELGVAALLSRAELGSELDAAVDRALEASHGFRGSLHGLNLHDVLQMFHLGRRTLSVYVGGRAPGRVDLERGEVVHAVSGPQQGREALTTILASSSGSMRTAPRVEASRSIHADFAALMLETAQQVDEAVRDSTAPALETPLDVAIDESAIDHIALPSIMPSFIDGAAGGDVWGIAVPSGAPRASDALCRALIAEIPGALAVVLLDLDSGELVGVEIGIPIDSAFERDLAAYFRVLFRGAEARALAARVEGTYVEEGHLSTRHGHFLGRALRAGTHALVVMLPRSGDVPAAWSAIRALSRGVESNL
jgi:hypothetical protein